MGETEGPKVPVNYSGIIGGLVYYGIERLALNVPDGPRAYGVHAFVSEDEAARWARLVPDGRRLVSGSHALVKWAIWHNDVIRHDEPAGVSDGA